jgi:hypothetical protein
VGSSQSRGFLSFISSFISSNISFEFAIEHRATSKGSSRTTPDAGKVQIEMPMIRGMNFQRQARCRPRMSGAA